MLNQPLVETSSLARLLSLEPQQWAKQQPLQSVTFAPITSHGIELLIKREDLLHPQLSGNKLYKLHGHLQAARTASARCLLSFGGYYSNHLHALSYAAAALQWSSIGLIRGHRPQQLSATLSDCERQGMKLVFLSRREYDEYKALALSSTELPASLETSLGQPLFDIYVVPEGGGDAPGLAGCGAMMNSLRQQVNLAQATVCLACGTGTTLAGMLTASRPGEQFLGVSALKLGDQLTSYRQSVEQQIDIEIPARWDIIDDSFFGGFARTTAELFDFIGEFETHTGILLEPVYTAKLLYQLAGLAGRGYWPTGHKLVVIHTGGLQGRRGYPDLTPPQS